MDNVIIFEGFDMVGKTTYIEKYKDKLVSEGKNVVILHQSNFSRYWDKVHSETFSWIVADNMLNISTDDRNNDIIFLLDRNLLSYYAYCTIYPPHKISRTMDNDELIEFIKTNNRNFIQCKHILLKPNEELSRKIYSNAVSSRVLDEDDKFEMYEQYKLYFNKFYELADEFYSRLGIIPEVLENYD